MNTTHARFVFGLLDLSLCLASSGLILVPLGARGDVDPELNLTIQRTNQNVVLSWFGATAVPYQVESSSSLSAWTDASPVIMGGNAILYFTNAITSSSPVHYRVKRLFPAAAGTAVFNETTGLLTIVGDDADNTFTVSRDAAGFILVNNGAVPIQGGVPTIANTVLIQILGQAGNDQLRVDNGLPPAHEFGGAGQDTLTGGSSADMLAGGPGNDILDGNQGSDRIFLGADDDTFRWDPGDGNDVVEGQAGNDVMVFNGASIAETLDLSASGGRLQFLRNVATVTLSVDGVERVDIQALGGADNVVVNNLTGTAVTQVNVDLAGTLGGITGDGLADTVTVNGTAASDTFNIAANGDVMEVTGLSGLVRVLHGESANDAVLVNGVGNDLVNVNGSDAPDTMEVLPSPVVSRLRANAATFTVPVDVVGALTLSVNGLGGTDTISGTGNVAGLGIALRIDGGEGNDTINGSNANETLVGGPGNDIIDGSQGADTILLGADDDTFRWDPGDGNDVVEGQAGNDVMVFNGASIAETLDLSASGGRLQFLRNVATVTLSVDGVERVDIQALGGADNVVVNNLTGTAVTQVNVDLAGTLGGITGDGLADTVTVNGTAASDTFNIAANGDVMEVTGLSGLVRVLHGESANDAVLVNGVGNDLVNVNGSDAPDTMEVLPSPVVSRLRANAATFTVPVDVIGALTLSVNGLGGTDTISGTGNVAGLGIALRIDGGEGNDTINGSNANETLLGGPGNDIIDGSQGADTILLGADDDTFRWDPGDGNDVVEGQAGNDVMVFNGASIAETLDLSANGGRLQFLRNVATVTLSVDGVERVDIQALGGADNVVVNNLTGTAVTQVNVDLAGTLGGVTGDALADTVTVNGTTAADTIDLSANADSVEVSGLAALVRIAHAESVNDTLVVNGLGGVDSINTGAGVTALIAVTINQD